MKDSDWICSVTLLLCVAMSIYVFLRDTYRYWVDRGIPYLPPKLFYGNVGNMHRTESIGMMFQRFYHELTLKGRGPFGGVYYYMRPVAVVTDLDFLERILTKDFDYFENRGEYYNEKDDPLSAHLFNMEGDKWRALRNKLLPTFSTGNIDKMFPTIVAAAGQLYDFMNNNVNNESELEMKDLLARYTTDVIGMCAFGIECNSIKDPDVMFRKMGRKIFQSNSNKLKRCLINVLPGLARKFRVKTTKPDVADFFMTTVRETIDRIKKKEEEREKQNKQKDEEKDFMELLINLKPYGDDKPLSFNEIAAQAYVFYAAGFETSSALLTWTLYELASNNNIQIQCRKHIQDILGQHDGQLTYESIKDMVYLDQIFNEALRKYPTVPVHIREAKKDYQLPDSNTIIEAGTKLFVPVLGIHRDKNIFPNPEEFDPNRFSPEEVEKRHRYAWTPFGEGRRKCIGNRFGLMQARIGLVYLLKNFEFSIGEKCIVPPEIETKSFMLVPSGGLWLKVKRIAGYQKLPKISTKNKLNPPRYYTRQKK
ncbi:probable cytochrome P450 6a14 [Sabethes cyaneus]|uniref:probable cytochrome P450 6a14 n=1 Tax=Sabethes cyaneus TaxID=53552 RepID=UPI00237D72D0|nr:probable cytochrome P450 6a14 [Sabethes cyaneus]